MNPSIYRKCAAIGFFVLLVSLVLVSSAHLDSSEIGQISLTSVAASESSVTALPTLKPTVSEKPPKRHGYEILIDHLKQLDRVPDFLAKEVEKIKDAIRRFAELFPKHPKQQQQQEQQE